MKLKVGDKAIVFNEEDIYGSKISLDSYLGKKVYLTFYRGLLAPFATYVYMR